jgi:hypothetical protein
MFSKINITCVLVDHCRTLRDFRTGKISGSDILVFAGIPLVVTAAFLYFRVYLTAGAVTTLLACFSILTGLLFSILLLILDLVQKEPEKKDEHAADKATRKIRSQLLRDTFSNISFCVLLAIILALISVGGIFDNHWVCIVISAIIYFGSANFVLTLLMVLKRIHVLLANEVGDNN